MLGEVAERSEVGGGQSFTLMLRISLVRWVVRPLAGGLAPSALPGISPGYAGGEGAGPRLIAHGSRPLCPAGYLPRLSRGRRCCGLRTHWSPFVAAGVLEVADCLLVIDDGKGISRGGSSQRPRVVDFLGGDLSQFRYPASDVRAVTVEAS